MAAGRIVLPPYFPARDRNARLVSGALLYVYENETTTKASIYSDSGLTTALANPVSANSSGQFPSIWAEAGSEASPTTYTLAITDADGRSIGNPAVFDDYRPSVDFETAALVLAEAAKDQAEEDAAAVAATYADILALEATGSTAAQVATRAAKNANLSDLADKEAALANIEAAGLPNLASPKTGSGTYAEVTTSRAIVGKAISGYSRGAYVPASTTGRVRLVAHDFHGASLSNELIRAEAGDYELEVDVAGVSVDGGRAAVTILGHDTNTGNTVGIEGQIRGVQAQNLTRIGLNLGFNSEKAQRLWTKGLIVDDVYVRSVTANDAFSIHGLLCYIPHAKLSNILIDGMYQATTADDEAFYTKAPFAQISNLTIIDGGKREGWLNIKGHGRPSATHDTWQDAYDDCDANGFEEGGLIEVLEDETRDGGLNYYQWYSANSGTARMVYTDGAHGYGVTVTNYTAICTDAYRTWAGSDTLEAVKVNTDEVTINSGKSYGPVDIALLTASGQPVNDLTVNGFLSYRGKTANQRGTFQFPSDKARRNRISGLTMVENQNANCTFVEVSGGIYGADYLFRDCFADTAWCGWDMSPAADDVMQVRIRGGKVGSIGMNCLRISEHRLKVLDVQDCEFGSFGSGSGSGFLGGNNRQASIVTLKNNKLPTITTTDSSTTIYGYFPMPRAGAGKFTIRVGATDGTDVLHQTLEGVYQNIAGTLTAINQTILRPFTETRQIPNSSAYTITANNTDGFTYNQPIFFSASPATPLTRVATLSGASGEYTVNTTTGVFTFNSVDAGKQVVLNYLARSPITRQFNSSGASSWTASVTASALSGSSEQMLRVAVKGATSKTIVWTLDVEVETVRAA